MINAISTAIGATILATLLLLAITWPTQFLWNNVLVVSIDGVNAISFWQTLGILILSSILFKNSSITTKND
tara:strand:+ start:149 stop:361 length:213 start_codon:yes stop_codon:yes gene_type:complete